MKKQTKEKLYNFINCGGMTAIIAALVIVFAVLNTKLFNGGEIEFMDWTIFTSIVIAMVLEIFSKILGKWLMNKLEDDVKLTSDYKKLAGKYINSQVMYDNADSDEENIKALKKINENADTKVKIPAICEYKLRGLKVKVEDNKEKYTLPDAVQERFDEIFAAHATSTVFNQLNIRMNDWEVQGDSFVVRTGRTTYFDSLVTNRAMDYRWKNGMSVRELFECGPYLNSLKDSKLSNHIGFNGFVESADGYVVFVKRGGQLSIGKRTYGNSIGASLKTKYALDDNGDFTEEGLKEGVTKEVRDELKIPVEQLEEFSAERNLIAAYRDLVEGGKPQFLVVMRSKWTKQEIQDNFEEELRKSKKEDMLEDGSKLLWIAKSDLKKMCIQADMMIHEGKDYHTMPSVAASTVMYIEYLRDEG